MLVTNVLQKANLLLGRNEKHIGAIFARFVILSILVKLIFWKRHLYLNFADTLQLQLIRCDLPIFVPQFNVIAL